MASRRFTSVTTALLLAVFMLANTVVLAGEAAVQQAQAGDVTALHHQDVADLHDHEHLNSDEKDCQTHHGCHSHSPLASPAANGFIAGVLPGPVWPVQDSPSLFSHTSQPPVPPPDRQLLS